MDKYKSTNIITRKISDYKYKISNRYISFIKKQLGKNKTITMDELYQLKLNIQIIIKSSFKYNFNRCYIKKNKSKAFYKKVIKKYLK